VLNFLYISVTRGYPWVVGPAIPQPCSKQIWVDWEFGVRQVEWFSYPDAIVRYVQPLSGHHNGFPLRISWPPPTLNLPLVNTISDNPVAVLELNLVALPISKHRADSRHSTGLALVI
jgi:hypothetical protein